MFHEGDLQSGIASAVQQSKAVFCFVHDDGENSKAWEREILKDPEISQAIRGNAVALRIISGSQEANFLSSFCPIVAIPTVVIIQNGAMKGIIPHTPSTRDYLKSRILEHLALSDSSSDAIVGETEQSAVALDSTSSADPVAPSRIASEPLRRDIPQQSLCVASSPAVASTPLSEDVGHESSAQLTDSIEEKKGTTCQNPEPEAGSEAKLQSNSSGVSAESPEKFTPQQAWTKVQRERERKQREERERIKAQIKHDHAERRRLEELRKQPAIHLTSHTANSSSESNSKRPKSSEVRLQVRTFDGSTIRSTFPKDSTISAQIRPWIDSNTEQSTPYSLKIILTPLPNHAIEAAEEGKALEDLDIIGSCTLVMVPVKGFVDSYAPSDSSILGSAVLSGYNLLSGSVGAVFGGVRSVFGFGQVTNEPATIPAPEEAPSRPSAGQVRIRTLADQRIEAQKKDQQFYNGNQLNFEPRKDDEDDKVG